MNLQKIKKHSFRVIITLALVAFAAATRLWPLHELGSTLVWITFYPTVMVAAIMGGLYTGLLAAAFSCVIAIYGWSFLVSKPFISTTGDWIGLGVFIFNTTLISSIAEAMLRANARTKIAQEQAEKAKEQAEAANKAKSIFLATMSHELRTPLNAILGFSNIMLADMSISQEQRENLAIINRSGDHLLSLINDVLDMAKIEAGRTILEPETFDIIALVRDMTDMMRVRAEEKGLQLLLDQSHNLPQFIKADCNKLRQIILNLLGNAIKYTAQGGVSLRIKIEATEPVLLILCVEDSGIGISATDIPHVFEPFVQVGQKMAQKGTGLGLAIVQQYAKLMGGSIRVESKLGKGSLFQLVLPIELSNASGVEQLATSVGKVIALQNDQPEYRILIIEDQEENWLLLSHLLESVGFKVKVAKNGEEGIALFQSFHPHFIWMDRRMPGMDGMEATRAIRRLKNGQAVKIVAVTASAFVEDRDEMLKVGMDDFVRKPYRASEIYTCLERHLGVRFAYEEKDLPSMASTTETQLSSTALAALPSELQQKLSDSLLLGNTEELNALLLDVARINLPLSNTLKFYLNSFNYLPLLDALEAIKNNSNTHHG